MSEEEFCINAEWAEVELLWGKGMYNWRWAFINKANTTEDLKNYENIFGFDE